MTGPQRPGARWEYAAPPDEDATTALARSLSVPRPLAGLLVTRGFPAEDNARRYLRPELDHLADPFAMAGMDAAVERIARAIRAGEVILVHGDYDVDGICSTALLTRSFRALGGRVAPFIPDRQRDGYDLGTAGVAAARAAGAGLVVTCDCGTTAVGPVADLASAGVDCIVTDHHLPGSALPEAYAVLNPRQEGDTSPDKDLAAVGVAYKLAMAVTGALDGNPNVVLNQLDLVALATVADVAPLRGENRVFVRRGLALMRETKNPGLRALIRSSGLDGREITAGRVGYTLAPRLNALGRIDSALRGVQLLLAGGDDEAMAIARHCEERNRERQEMDRSILESVLERVRALPSDTWGIALADERWHPGVIGIVASRVVEQTGRPTFLVAVQGGVGKGSGRSIPAFDLHAALGECADLLVKHGGHRAAAGLTIEPHRVELFAERFNAIARGKLTEADLLRVVHVDLVLPVSEATDDLERMLRSFEPFGVANPGPTFVSPVTRLVSGATRIGTDGVKFLVESGSGPVEAVGWGLAPRARDLAAGVELSLAYRIERNTFRGANRLQLNVVDFRRG
ncbi:MAG: single-stranded-DNA-specific exonuclease RecJ [Gemmatimonadaceae bacterium]|nr:single-stranded-DNA-specific exonuclease RecJ [Gemmatimonadaceae bacterium]